MNKKDQEEIRKIANEEMDRRVKPKKGKIFGDPICEIEQ